MFVQGYLIRIAVPKLGLRRTGIMGLGFNLIAFVGYAYAETTLLAFFFLVPGALGALASPAMNGIASSQMGPDLQGDLQGAMGSMGSLTSVISPPVMTMTFGIFSDGSMGAYFPGAPFILAAFLTLLSILLFVKTTTGFTIAEQVT